MRKTVTRRCTNSSKWKVGKARCSGRHNIGNEGTAEITNTPQACGNGGGGGGSEEESTVCNQSAQALLAG
jgi:hypothetical protein